MYTDIVSELFDKVWHTNPGLSKATSSRCHESDDEWKTLAWEMGIN